MTLRAMVEYMLSKICKMWWASKESGSLKWWTNRPSLGPALSKLLRHSGMASVVRLAMKLNTLPKIHVLTWRVGHELLPMNAKIASIHQGFRQDCPRCSVDKETLIHALKDCSTVRAILSISGLDNKLLIKGYYCCINWMEDMMRVLDKKAIVNFVTTLWNSWNN
ncbi:hypothetical protein PVK06_017547 [Gossypium arboreum]|uniref:Reverse transcriptase zinc-binding domain-containing protein n=1 Tax=Gossypium arboreum TaxID=29729 RepID=A0ABR0Q2Y2_GOSAR|nr:hypothetical protein PVK06_017547 [Gossypium arboreum]